LLSRIPVFLSLALASSGICNSLQKLNLELEARVGIGQTRKRGKRSKRPQEDKEDGRFELDDSRKLGRRLLGVLTDYKNSFVGRSKNAILEKL